MGGDESVGGVQAGGRGGRGGEGEGREKDREEGQGAVEEGWDEEEWEVRMWDVYFVVACIMSCTCIYSVYTCTINRFPCSIYPGFQYFG